MSSTASTLESLKRKTLDQVEWLYRQGHITQDVYDAYCHLWQTSAPRFAVQACHCAECLKTGPAADHDAYRGLPNA